jgi:aspartyl-tRNA(Asn)/glutamyl-tRNA(Gln) amidotransferase subunit A
VAFASSLDQIGPFAQYVDDAALILESLCGFDPHDSTSENRSVEPFSVNLVVDSLKGKCIGVPNQLMSQDIASDVRQSISGALKRFESLGASIDYFDFDLVDEALATYYIIAPAEVSSNLSRFDGVRYGNRNTSANSLKEMIQITREEGFGDEVKRRIILGTYVLSSGYYDAYYGKAQKVRAVVSETYANLFKSYDFICSPTAPTTAFEKGANLNDPMQMYLSDIATIPVNLAGLPAISFPCGLDSSGAPIGCQLVGGWFKEHALLQAAHAFERALEFQPKYLFEGVL